MKKIKILLGTIFLLIVSASLDLVFRRFESLNESYSDGLHPVIPWGTEMVVYLLLGVVLLYLARMVLYRNSRSYMTASILIILGAVSLFLFTYPGYHIFTSLVHFPYALPNQVWSAQACYLDVVLSSFSFARNCAGLVMAIGLLRLLPEKKLESE
jgi:hypothetical protein